MRIVRVCTWINVSAMGTRGLQLLRSCCIFLQCVNCASATLAPRKANELKNIREILLRAGPHLVAHSPRCEYSILAGICRWECPGLNSAKTGHPANLSLGLKLAPAKYGSSCGHLRFIQCSEHCMYRFSFEIDFIGFESSWKTSSAKYGLVGDTISTFKIVSNVLTSS
ncbi:hypothetical protein DFJ43DRAFT_799169 [Lentinula guzmanii]|uniref:Secreted protein n=1 Tax=Lentinula guzmanii TaxID=2804957 RepID=A0AA38J8W5_9AGAR|nr:hypothetical protein DFJ43DRAFT_799169 [Lentinula guzmanii]